MVAFVTTMPGGIPGALSRFENAVIESQMLNPTYPFASYGIPYKASGGYAVPLVAADLPSVIQGFLIRAYPVQNAVANEPLGTNTPLTTGMASCLRSGYLTVKCNAGTPALGGQVYTRVANAGGGTPIGGIEATSVIGASGAANGGNTGNGTIGTVSAVAPAQTGVYRATMTGATTFTVRAPDGDNIGPAGATGTPYTVDGVTFTITVGVTPMVAGDYFNITVAPETVPIADCQFQCPKDSAGNVEISFKP